MHLFTLLHSEMPKALSILSAVVYEIHLHLIMSLMRAYIPNTFINFIALRNVKFITNDLIL